MEESGPALRGGLGSVDNALRLLLLFRSHGDLGISEAAALLGVSRSTAHRLMTSLVRRGFVLQDPQTRAYRPGAVLRELSIGVDAGDDTEVRCRPYLAALCHEMGETVNLVALRGADAVFLVSVETPRPLRIGSRRGVVLPAHAVSAGKALLAALPEHALMALYSAQELTALTHRTLRTRAALVEELEVGRRRGYATNLGESEPDITAAGAVVPGLSGGQPLAVAVSAPSSRVRDEEDLSVIGQAARACAENIARAFARAGEDQALPRPL